MSGANSHGLGRLAAPDARDAAYPMRALIAEAPTRTSYYFTTGPILNQGQTGTCVGHGWRQWLSSALIMEHGGPGAFVIYTQACKIDEWPENDDGDLQAGTSVRAGVQVLQALGYVAEYRWTWSATVMRDWLLLGKGVLVMGTNWTEDMFNPDRRGVIHATGAVAGGHCYVVSGVNRKTGLFRITNSWGRGWGQNGRAWISGEDVQSLLDNQGECCTASEALPLTETVEDA